MDPLLSGYALALGAVFLLWVGVSLFVVATRAVYDVRLRFVVTARRLIERRIDTSSSETPELDWVLRRLPLRTIQRVAADASTSAHVAEAFARHAVARSGTRLLDAAGGHTGGLAKWRRIDAMRILARADLALALPLLERALADADDDVANAALVTLGATEDVRAARLLVDALRVGRLSHSRVATQLNELAVDIDELLVPLLRDWTPEVRYWAVKLLARRGELASLSVELAAFAADPDAAVRAAVAETLGAVGGPAAVSVAISLLDDPVPFVRAHAARALGAQRRPEFAEPLARLLADEDWWVRSGAKRGLETLGPAASEHVVPHLRSADRFARNGAAEVLQNTGVLDRLVRDVTADPDDVGKRRLLRLALDAGGAELGAAAVARAGGEDDVLALLDDIAS